MSVIGVAPQQAVHVSVRRSYDDLRLKAVDPAHHAVASIGLSKFIGVLPDNAQIIKSNFPGKNAEEHAVSVQISGLCSACVFTNEDRSTLVAGMPIIYNVKDSRLEIGTAVNFAHSVAKFVDYVEEFPGHSGDHIHAIISLTALDQPDDDVLDSTTNYTRVLNVELTREYQQRKALQILKGIQDQIASIRKNVAGATTSDDAKKLFDLITSEPNPFEKNYEQAEKNAEKSRNESAKDAVKNFNLKNKLTILSNEAQSKYNELSAAESSLV